MSANEERIILEGIAAGDTSVIKAFYKKNYNYIRRYVLQNSGDEADVEDVFQDALVVIYQKLKSDSLDIDVSIRTYFYAICKNLWRSRLRKKRKLIINTEVVGLSEDSEEPFTKNMENHDREHLYRKYFITLSDACKHILNLVFAGNRMKEIAILTGYTEGYARKKKFECKKSLLEKIEKDPIYHELKITSEKES